MIKIYKASIIGRKVVLAASVLFVLSHTALAAQDDNKPVATSFSPWASHTVDDSMAEPEGRSSATQESKAPARPIGIEKVQSPEATTAIAPKEDKQNQPQLTAQDIQKAFEKAMKDIEKDKAEKEKAKVDTVKAQFREEAERWLAQAAAKESQGLNSFVDQEWEKLNQWGPYVHYNYYLRDFEFVDKSYNITETGNLLAPYKASIDMTEKRYVERYHTPDISYINDYLFTVTTPLKANFEYRDERFVFINTEKGRESIENVWPRKVKDKFKIKP